MNKNYEVWRNSDNNGEEFMDDFYYKHDAIDYAKELDCSGNYHIMIVDVTTDKCVWDNLNF
jgi:hypothetical protein